MTIDVLIDDLSTDGIVLVLHKGQIKASGPSGTISADVVARLRTNKPDIIQFLKNDLLNRAAAAVPGVTAEDLRNNLDAEHWRDIDLICFESLRGLAHAIRNTRDLAAGRVPEGWDAITECAVCGPVPIFPGGSKAVLGCPWCLNGQAPSPLPGNDQ